ncbi:MAG: hypothetical protein WCH43_11100, partial [Verrucomicrobiota bacterium]
FSNPDVSITNGVAIIAMMIIIVIPMVIVGSKRSKAENVLNDLKALDVAVHQYAVDTGRSSGFNPVYPDLKKYLDKNSYVYRTGGKDVRGNIYGPFIVDTPPRVPDQTFIYFSGVVEDSYWSIYH